MKSYLHILFFTISLLICISCGKTTEQYALKEHGMKFDIWELNYNADSYGIYWPVLKMGEASKGELQVLSIRHDWFKVYRDTTLITAALHVSVKNSKSSHDAKQYNYIRFKLDDYFPIQVYNFVFNEGENNSVSFSDVPSDSGYLIPDKETSEKIISLLCNDTPTNIKITYNGTNSVGKYSFIVNGSSKLSKALEINRERSILAQEEYKKVKRQ